MKKILPALALLMAATGLFTSCNDNSGRKLADYPDATTGDSLIWYYSQMKAWEYWSKAERDTSYRSKAERDEFMDGVRAGFKAVRMKDGYHNYNDGVKLGVRMAMNLINFEELYDVDLDDEILIESLAYGLNAETPMPELTAQKNFYRLMGRMKMQREDKARQISHNTLVELARKKQLVKIDDDLYYKIVNKGSGPNAIDGDVMYISAEYQRADGADLGMPSPEMVTVGATGVPAVLNRIYRHLNSGASAVFATSAGAIFGPRSEIMGLLPADVVVITITVNDISTPDAPLRTTSRFVQ